MFDIKDGTLVKYTGEESRVVIPPNVTKIGCKAFGDNKIIEAVYIPDSVECIEYSTFEYCSNLKVISYNAKCDIPFRFCYCCSSLKLLKLKHKINSVGREAFSDCSSLTDLTFLNNVSKIEDSVFYGCNALENVKIPDNVEDIGEFAFESCTNLTRFYFPEGIKYINNGVLKNCFNMEYLHIPTSVEIMYGSLLDDKTSIYSNFDECIKDKDSVSLNLNEGKRKHPYQKLKLSNNLPNVKYIANALWMFGTNMWNSYKHSMTTKGGALMVGHRPPLFAKVVTIGAGFKSISGYYARDALDYEVVTVAEGVEYIGIGCFCDSKPLREVILPSTLKYIDELAFAWCPNLKTIKIKNDIEFIHDDAFYACSADIVKID